MTASLFLFYSCGGKGKIRRRGKEKATIDE